MSSTVRLHCEKEDRSEQKVLDIPRLLAKQLRRRLEKAGWIVEEELLK